MQANATLKASGSRGPSREPHDFEDGSEDGSFQDDELMTQQESKAEPTDYGEDGNPLSPPGASDQTYRPASEASTQLRGSGTRGRMGATTGSSFYSHKSGSYAERAYSAPLLHGGCIHSTHASTWRSGGSSGSGFREPNKPSWQPLGGTWRDWDTNNGGERLRTTADDGRAYLHGCVPHWSKHANVRMQSCIEHDMNWAYYRMRRHSGHPLRAAVGDPHLPNENIVESMRSGVGSMFQFWRDLRPPFVVCNMKRVDDGGTTLHGDGTLYEVTYECGIDYVSERLWGTKQDGGTFDNKIHGVAQVRIPECFPKQRPLRIESWGNPMLNWSADDKDPDQAGAGVNASLWNPLANELGLSPNHPRCAKMREAAKRAQPRKAIDVPPLQRLLLGPHASLPRLVQAQNEFLDSQKAVATPAVPGQQPATALLALAAMDAAAKSKKTRKHRIWTQAAGFVNFAG